MDTPCTITSSSDTTIFTHTQPHPHNMCNHQTRTPKHTHPHPHPHPPHTHTRHPNGWHVRVMDSIPRAWSEWCPIVKAYQHSVVGIGGATHAIPLLQTSTISEAMFSPSLSQSVHRIRCWQPRDSLSKVFCRRPP